MGAARADDTDTLLKDLQDPAARPAAVGRLDKIPRSSLARVANAAFDQANPQAMRTLIDSHLPAIYARLRAEEAAQIDADRTAWIKAALEDPYRKRPRTNPKYDALALTALVNLQHDETNFAQLQAARDAGCDNVLLVALHQIRGLELRQLDAAAAGPALDAAVKSFDKSGYPDGTKFYVRMQLLGLMNSLDWPAEFPSKMTLADEADRTFKLFPKFLDQHPDHELLGQLVFSMWNIALSAGPTQAVAYARISGLVAGPLGDDPIVKKLNCRDLMGQGRALAMGDGPTPAAVFTLWNQATQAAIEGWQINPLDTACCQLPLIASFDRLSAPDVDKWVRLGNLASPNSDWFCQQKLAILMHQMKINDALAWAKECLNKGTARDRWPIVLINAHLDFADAADDRTVYLKRADVWSDMQAVCVKMLADTSRARDQRDVYLTDRATYWRIAVDAEQWQLVLTLSQQFGDEIDMHLVGGKDLYAYEQKVAREHLQTEGKTIAAPAARIPLPPADARQVRVVAGEEAQIDKKGKKAKGGTTGATPSPLDGLP